MLYSALSLSADMLNTQYLHMRQNQLSHILFLSPTCILESEMQSQVFLCLKKHYKWIMNSQVSSKAPVRVYPWQETILSSKILSELLHLPVLKCPCPKQTWCCFHGNDNQSGWGVTCRFTGCMIQTWCPFQGWLLQRRKSLCNRHYDTGRLCYWE